MKSGAYLKKRNADYLALGIEKEPAIREDGMRTSGRSGSCEWWYFDAEYSDGTKIVIIFFTKLAFSVKGPACPMVMITMDFPDGKRIFKVSLEGIGKNIQASKDKCDVTIGRNTAFYSDGNYLIHYEDGDIAYDCVMKPRMPMWRPGTGHWSFTRGNREEYFAWFVAQPSAELEATLRIGSKTVKLEGNGYHDHNWFEIRKSKMLNHWYWCRARVGPYMALCCDLVSEKKYGYTRLPVFMLAKDGIILSDNEELLAVERSDTEYHPGTGKFIDNNLIYTFKGDKGATYRIEFNRKGDLLALSMVELLKMLTRKADNGPILKTEFRRENIIMGFTALEVPRFPSVFEPLAKAVMSVFYNPTYIRCVGDVRITVEENGETEVFEREGLWEQMFHGKNRDAIINV
ncbi:MAG: hypothetical protein JW738_03580 [Actinobacteria bacterium]|nr:hypothetical protein [Actinomycetota bacterium]